MIWQLDLFLFVILVVLAVLALRVRNLMGAVTILSGFSLVVAVMFTSLAAADVAFVEAVLGAGFTGILFILLIRATGQHAVERNHRGQQLLVLPLIGLFVALMVYASGGLPDRGDPEAPAQVHLAPDFIEGAVPDMRTPNIVTAVLADYRSMDTLGEVLVIFTAGMAVLVIMRRRTPEPEDRPRPSGATGEDPS